MDFCSVFQCVDMHRPLMSVSKICANGYQCKFAAGRAEILDEKGQIICKFEEQNGVYVGRLRLRAPTPFGRQA